MSACCSDSEASTIPGDPLIVSEGGDAADIPPPLADTQLDTDSEVVSVTDSECGEQGSIYIYIYKYNICIYISYIYIYIYIHKHLSLSIYIYIIYIYVFVR
jgi:hypothetical protein